MLTDKQKDKLISIYKQQLPSDWDKGDVESDIDTSLTYSEAYNMIMKKVELLKGQTFDIEEYEEVARQLVKTQQDKTKNKNVEFINQIANKSTITIILGKRGSGKTALGFYLLEQLKPFTTRTICTVGFPKKTPFPNYDSIEKAPLNSIVLIDEGSLKYDARKAFSKANLGMTDLLRIARHNDVSIVFITQNSADIEVRTLRQADIFLLKEPSLVQEYLERSFIKRLYQHVKELFTSELDNTANYYVFSDAIQGLYSFSLPSFWTEEISKSHRTRETILPDLFQEAKSLYTQKCQKSLGDKVMAVQKPFEVGKSSNSHDSVALTSRG